jgi:hypothetical protein
MCKKLMEWNGTQWNQFHPIPLNPSIFHSSQFGRYPMEWNIRFLILLFCPYFICLFLFSNTPISLISLHHFFLRAVCDYSFLLRFMVQLHTWFSNTHMDLFHYYVLFLYVSIASCVLVFAVSGS